MKDGEMIIYHTDDGKAAVTLMSRDGSVWLTQKQMAELYGVSVPNISMLIAKIIKEGELDPNSVIHPLGVCAPCFAIHRTECVRR